MAANIALLIFQFTGAKLPMNLAKQLRALRDAPLIGGRGSFLCTHIGRVEPQLTLHAR